jgi:transposase
MEVVHARCAGLDVHKQTVVACVRVTLQPLRVVATLQATIAELAAAITAALAPYRTAVAHLVSIPGVSTTPAQILVAEIGVDMSRFPSTRHLLSWAGLCPRQDASAGKHRSTRLRKGAPWRKPVLVQGAWAAVRGRASYLRAQFLRLKQRRGPMKAIVAVAASMITAAYYLLRDGEDYRVTTWGPRTSGAATTPASSLAHPPPAPPRLRGHPPPRRLRSPPMRVTW